MLTPRRTRVAALASVAAALLATTVATASPAAADDPSTLTVVGTSDVFDSNLVQAVIKPGFEAAYPQYTLNYVSKGTGAAIAYAEAGSASALLVHAAALENQFVAAGYSDLNQFGNAFFWGDYVLLGPNSDPLNISGQYPHDIAGAFEKVAVSGAKGKANFVSRGGTPGTTVQEHAIWALTNGVQTCDVSDVNGGGKSPSTSTGACPLNIPYPSWYHATGLTQGPNIVNADACNYSGGNCYVLTDRGTYNYLRSTGAAQNLKVVVRNNATNARGGIPLLVNSFHGYAVNPAKFAGNPNVQLNEQAALLWLQWVQSPAAQTAIGNYLSSAPGGAPFLPSAAPLLTASAPPAATVGSKSFSITGRLSNVVPGTPALANKSVGLWATPTAGGSADLIATTTTDGSGKYRFTVAPSESATYEVRTDQITQIENADLDPVFGDILAPQRTTAGDNEVIGQPVIKSASLSQRTLILKGNLAPDAVDGNATLTLLASKDGSLPANFGTVSVAQGASKFNVHFRLASGSYQYQLQYEDGAHFSLGLSGSRTVVVP